MAQVQLDEGDLNALADRITAKVVEQFKTLGIHPDNFPQRQNTGEHPGASLAPGTLRPMEPTDGRSGSQMTKPQSGPTVAN